MGRIPDCRCAVVGDCNWRKAEVAIASIDLTPLPSWEASDLTWAPHCTPTPCQPGTGRVEGWLCTRLQHPRDSHRMPGPASCRSDPALIQLRRIQPLGHMQISRNRLNLASALGQSSFDIGVSMFGLMFFPDRARALPSCIACSFRAARSWCRVGRRRTSRRTICPRNSSVRRR